MNTASRGLVLLYAICLLSNIFGGMTSTLMSLYLPSAVNDLQSAFSEAELDYMGAFINGAFILGWTFGGVGWGFFSDYRGRSLALGASILCLGLFTALTGFANSLKMVVLFRFLAGFGVGGVLVITPTILTERWPVKSKDIVIGILSVGFPLGIFSSGALVLFVQNWHVAFLTGFIPLVLGIVSLAVVKGNVTGTFEKRELKYNAFLERVNLRNLVTGAVSFGTMLIGLWAIFSWMPTWIQSLVSSGSTKESGISMMILGGIGMAGGFASGWVSNAIGYRKSLLLCFAFCFAMSCLLFKVHKGFSWIMYAEIGVLALFFGASQGILSAYVPSLFPESIRGIATGFCFNMGRIFTAGAVFFVGVLVEWLGGYGEAIFTFSFVFVVGFFATFIVKEINSDIHAAH